MAEDCNHCDRKVHHGRVGTYTNHRCRCELCRAARAAYSASYLASDAGRAVRARYGASEKRRYSKARYQSTGTGRALHAARVARYRSTDKGRTAVAAKDARYRVTEKARATDARYRASDRGRAANAAANVRRRSRAAGATLVIRSSGGDCGVCSQLLTDARWPDPKATTIGHEPPLSRLAALGHPPVLERPEHLICNLRKGTRTVQELQSINFSPDIAAVSGSAMSDSPASQGG